MVSFAVLGVVCGIGVIGVLFVGFLAVCLLCRRHGRVPLTRIGSVLVDRGSYEAVGDYKPPSVLSVSSTSQPYGVVLHQVSRHQQQHLYHHHQHHRCHPPRSRSDL
ncbi:hypothetical protein ElyMa_001907400 [Elysia marginata]|uniref:Uncharacterized protein n=1 Tax=Elysia marginata TaxID=1093978 RepID=A0AAV4ESY3_9GAST|nr:hypothetical protein ElyMa_001907400 [Elysia marginata]